jgi:hypothetical protein
LSSICSAQSSTTAPSSISGWSSSTRRIRRRHISAVTSPTERGVIGLCTRLRDTLAELPVGAEVDVEQYIRHLLPRLAKRAGVARRGLRFVRCSGSRSVSGRWRLSATSSRVVENMRGLQADEPAVGAGERKGFRASVYRLASAYGVKRDPFVPAVPSLMPAERAAHTCIAALEEIEDVLHRNSTRSTGGRGGDRRSGRPLFVLVCSGGYLGCAPICVRRVIESK